MWVSFSTEEKFNVVLYQYPSFISWISFLSFRIWLFVKLIIGKIISDQDKANLIPIWPHLFRLFWYTPWCESWVTEIDIDKIVQTIVKDLFNFRKKLSNCYFLWLILNGVDQRLWKKRLERCEMFTKISSIK